RDLPCARRGRRVDNGWRPDLGHLVLSGVDVQEEVDQCALERRTGAPVDGKARAGDLRAALQVEHPQPLPDLPVGATDPALRARAGGVRQRLTPGPNDSVCILA